MQTEENRTEFYAGIMKLRDEADKSLPEVAAAAVTVRDAVYKDGALSTKVKRLIAMGIALSLRCDPCIVGQTKLAVEAGATRQEVLEAASVLLAIHGTSGYGEIWQVVKVLEEMGVE